ncbi:hypothetical protein ACKKBF_B36165 [Auxenochlorella protothecoides x Auxenochlorella symbiontica]
MFSSPMIPVPGMHAETGSGGRLLDACDLEADTIGVASVPSSASSAVLSDYFIFDTEPLLADWGTLPPINPGPYRSAPRAASAGQPWAAGPTTGYAGSFGHTPAITESSPFLLDGTALTSTLPPSETPQAWLQPQPSMDGLPSPPPYTGPHMPHTQSLPELHVRALPSRRSEPELRLRGPGSSRRGPPSHPLPRSASASQLLDGCRPAVPHMTYLTPLHLRKGKGGRQPAADPRMDPRIDPKKARRILANRLSAAKSKLKQKGAAGEAGSRLRHSSDDLVGLEVGGCE